jgi:DNA-binding XRE family transcriptional regulator
MPRIIDFLGYILFDMQFEDPGQKICAYRQLLGLRQKDLALKIGVDATTVGYLERGEHKPTKRLARALDDYFLSGTSILPLKHKDSSIC